MREHGYVLVGLGDEQTHEPALDWAAREALARGTEVRVVRAYGWPQALSPWEELPDGGWVPLRHAEAQTRLREALGVFSERYPEVPVSTESVDADPASALLDRAGDAAVTVLGSRQLGPAGAALLGSVSTLVAARADGPVVVVGASAALPALSVPAGGRGCVVVGVDGSPESEHALGYGFEYASRHGCDLHAVHCWRRHPLTETEEPQQRAERWLAEAVAGWQEKYPDVTVQRLLLRDRPVEGLLRACAGAGLLVVGRRSRHARLSAVLGSVSQALLRHAPCPVAVVH